MIDKMSVPGVEKSISSGSSAVAKQIASGSKEVSKSLDQIGKGFTNLGSAQSVDLLTEKEVNELRKLVSLDLPEAQRYSIGRVKDPEILGMYQQLSDLGFINVIQDLTGSFFLTYVYPRANWAIYRFDKKVEEEKARNAEIKRQRRTDRLFSLLVLISGWILGLFSPTIIDFIASLTNTTA